jgi:hypothetical protein
MTNTFDIRLKARGKRRSLCKFETIASVQLKIPSLSSAFFLNLSAIPAIHRKLTFIALIDTWMKNPEEKSLRGFR